MELNIKEAVDVLRAKISSTPTVGIILGTGLGTLVTAIEIEYEIPYEQIPHFVSATVEHHAGRLIFGNLGGKPVVCMSGRFHYYEGYSLQEITFPVRVMKALGVETLLISNVSGGLNETYGRGDLMIIDDHINLLGTNPLIGPNSPSLGDRWPDMIEPYSKKLQKQALDICNRENIKVHACGIYACMSGPSLETRAEYRMLRTLGADAIGMSTVPEVIVATQLKLNTFACSIITDLCTPSTLKPVDIEEIISTAAKAEPRLVLLMEQLIRNI